MIINETKPFCKKCVDLSNMFGRYCFTHDYDEFCQIEDKMRILFIEIKNVLLKNFTTRFQD